MALADATPYMFLAPGTRLGPYDIVAPLGAGGMGEVYRAHDTTLGRDVAIKVLPAAWSSDPERLARFDREARLLASLNHPNIGAIYGVTAGDGIRGLVLELVDGPTLADRISGSGLPVQEAVAIARQIVDALEAAHEHGVVHRDLKPSNIKLKGVRGAPDVTVKVLDFGLAKLTHESAGGDISDVATRTLAATRDGVVVGTAAYMSPEQARGRAVDKRTDIWAFGCVLYEMLTGRPVFSGETISDIIARILERDPAWDALPPEVPPSIRRLLTRCLVKDPRLRLRDIGDARPDLDESVRGEAGGPSAASAGAAAGAAAAARVSARSAWVAWTIAAILAAGLAVAVFRPWMSGGSKAVTLSHATRITNTPAEEFGPVISPDDKWVAYYSNSRGPTDVWVKFLETGATLNLTQGLPLVLPVRAGLGGLAVSPDGGTLAFYARPDTTEPTFDTWVMPVPVGGAPHRLMQGMQGLQWSPDGSQIACIQPGSSAGDALVIAGGDGSHPRIVVAAEGGYHIHWPVWSRDGRFVYFIYTQQAWNTEPAEIYRVPAAGGTPEAVVRSARRAVYPVPMPGGGLIYAANPDHADLGLWWRPPSGGTDRALTTGFGEHTEARLSADGNKLVATFTELRQAIAQLPINGGPAPTLRPITDGYTGDLDPTVEPSGTRLVFSSSRSGDRNLWTSKLDGSDPRPLTSGPFIDERPAYSPDGRTVAFVSDRGGQRGIWLVNADGGVPQRLAAVDVLDNLAWTHDGARIVFARPERNVASLSAVAVSNGKIDPFPTPGPAVMPAWSPNGEELAYLEPSTVASAEPLSVPVSRMDLRFVDRNGHPLHAGLPPASNSNGFLVWAPDGRRLARIAVNANTPSSVWIIEPNAGAVRKVCDLPSAIRPRGVSWSPDGTALVIASQQSVSDIVLYDVGN